MFEVRVTEYDTGKEVAVEHTKAEEWVLHVVGELTGQKPGAFYEHLIRAAFAADSINFKRLAREFPHITTAIDNYRKHGKRAEMTVVERSAEKTIATETRRNEKLVAAIHLYGSRDAGHGYIIDAENGFKADSQTDKDRPETLLRKGRSATDAIFLAVQDLKEHGVTRGIVVVHYDFPHGPRVAKIDIGWRIPYFGELKWEQGETVVVSAEEIERARS